MTDPAIEKNLQLAIQHHQAGRLAEAEALYRAIIARDPKNADALHMLGVLAGQTGHIPAAIDLIRQAISFIPMEASYYSNLGKFLIDSGDFDAAITACHRAILLDNDNAGARYNLGISLHRLGRFDAAIASFHEVLRKQPGSADAWFNLGVSQHAAGLLHDAIASLRKSLGHRPSAGAHFSLGVALSDVGCTAESIDCFRDAIAADPAHGEAFNSLGNALKTLGEFNDAVTALREAVRLRSQWAGAHANLADALIIVGSHEQAVALLRTAIELEPRNASIQSQLVFALNYLESSTRESLFAESRLWNETHAAALSPSVCTYDNDRDPGRRLRIGYVGSDFRANPAAFFIEPLLRSHDRARVEVFCYAQVAKPDILTERLQKLSDHFVFISNLSDDALVEQIRRDKIDILIDLNLHTAGHRLLLFARRPAPVQVTWLAYPGTTGLSAIDYRLTDRFLDPPEAGSAFSSEKPVELPDSFWCYLQNLETPEVNPLPARAAGYITFGCLNAFCKVSAVALEAWSSLLQKIPDARLILHAPPGGHRERVLATFADRGVAPSRCEFLPRVHAGEYYATYHRIDVALDPFPVAGGTTTFDALWMGVPVVTLAGRTGVGRGGVSILSNLGLSELIAQTTDQYVELAAAFANDLPRLAELRATLRLRLEKSPLMDAPRFARNVEAIYRQMWRKWCERSPS